MSLDDKTIERIVNKVVERLESRRPQTTPAPIPAPTPAPAASASAVTDGVFRDMEECVRAANTAHLRLVALPLEVRAAVIQAVRDTARKNAEFYARMEFEETGLGKYEDNVMKILAASRVAGMEDLEPEVFSGDKGLTVIERIPVGVIASINPVTNGGPTILFNAIMMLAGGNAVVDNPHPKTKKASARLIRDLNAAIVGVGGPPNCICCLEVPSVPSAQHLMTHKDVGLIAVTGGHGVVAFATGTGKRVIAGGPGNPPVVIDETADLDRAAQCVIEGASFSNCIACASEKELFPVASIADRFKELLIKYGAYELTAEQGARLVEKIFKEVKGPGKPGVINMDYIGRTPHSILKEAIGLVVPEDVKIAILETDKDHPLVWTEQIMPILPFVRCPDVDTAIDRAIAAEQGNGHTMAIHSTNIDNMRKIASRAKCAAIVKNGSCGLSSVGVTGEGYISFHIATNGEGHTRPRMFTRVRRCVMRDDLRYRYGAGPYV